VRDVRRASRYTRRLERYGRQVRRDHVTRARLESRHSEPHSRVPPVLQGSGGTPGTESPTCPIPGMAAAAAAFPAGLLAIPALAARVDATAWQMAPQDGAELLTIASIAAASQLTIA